MIYSVTGKLAVVDPAFAVVEACGVGYRCSTTLTTLSQLPPLGETVTLYTYLAVREDAIELFGFADQEELRCFRMLTTVSGVGPKAALAILSTLTPARLLLSIAAGDAKALTKAPGVGPKLAQRILLELRDKVGAADAAAGFASAGPGTDAAASSQGEAINALVTLGYGATDAAAVVARIDGSLPVDEIVKQALRRIARGNL